nr:hypothetical protein [Tanacetum cinerariifolium]
FWQTATASTLNNGEIEITVTIDGKVKVITEAFVKRHLKLEDSDGISTFPTTKIFKQLALMGVKDQQSQLSLITHPRAPLTSQPHLLPTPKKSIRQEIKVLQLSSPPHTNVADKAASTGVDVRHGGVATTVTSLDAGHGNGNINKTLSMPHDLPLLIVHTLRSDEGKMQHNELMDLVTKLLDKVVALETDLKQIKKVYGVAYTKLIMTVKKLEKTDKTSKARRRAKIIVSDDEEYLEDPSKQGRKIDEID